MPALRNKTAPALEKRLEAVAAWSGTNGSFAKEAQLGPLEQRTRTFAQDVPSDVEYALDVLRTIDGLAVVVHGPAGCASGLHSSTSPGAPWAVTNLNERDSIMGGDAKLRQAIVEIHKARSPKAIAVVATPVVAINNDDIDTVTDELRDELSIPVIPVYTDGFRSRIGSTGHDVAVHALIRHILPVRKREDGPHINLLSVSENRADVDSILSLLSALGIQSVVFPRFSQVAQAHKVVGAKLSIALDPDSAGYAGEALQETYGIPLLSPPPPVGVEGTKRWLSALGGALGIASATDAFARSEAAKLSSVLLSSQSYAGTKVFVNLPTAKALAFGGLARELGLQLTGVKVPWIAAHHGKAASELAGDAQDIPLIAGDGQFFEEVNFLRKNPPDLYVTAGPPPVHALRLGIPVLNLEGVPLLGFAGVERIARGIERVLGNTSLVRFLSEGTDEPYAPTWLKKSIHWYIKQEVK